MTDGMAVAVVDVLHITQAAIATVQILDHPLDRNCLFYYYNNNNYYYFYYYWTKWNDTPTEVSSVFDGLFCATFYFCFRGVWK